MQQSVEKCQKIPTKESAFLARHQLTFTHCNLVWLWRFNNVSFHVFYERNLQGNVF